MCAVVCDTIEINQYPTVALVTICGRSRSDRPAIYYVRPLLDLVNAVWRSEAYRTGKASVFIYSWGYFRELLHALGVTTHFLNPEEVARLYFQGDLWTTDPQYFVNTNEIQAREPLLYATWLTKLFVLREVARHTQTPILLWLDCSYAVSYCCYHTIEHYLANFAECLHIDQAIPVIAQWLEQSPIILAGRPPALDITLDNVHESRPIAGAFLAVRRHFVDSVWDIFCHWHRLFVNAKRLYTDEDVYAIGLRHIAQVRPVAEWHNTLYGPVVDKQN